MTQENNRCTVRPVRLLFSFYERVEEIIKAHGRSLQLAAEGIFERRDAIAITRSTDGARKGVYRGKGADIETYKKGDVAEKCSTGIEGKYLKGDTRIARVKTEKEYCEKMALIFLPLMYWYIGTLCGFKVHILLIFFNTWS